MTKDLPVRSKHAAFALAAGLVIPILYVVAARINFEGGKEWIPVIGNALAALTALFALLSAQDANRFKQVMPPLIIFAAVITVFVPVATGLTEGLGL